MTDPAAELRDRLVAPEWRRAVAVLAPRPDNDLAEWLSTGWESDRHGNLVKYEGSTKFLVRPDGGGVGWRYSALRHKSVERYSTALAAAEALYAVRADLIAHGLID